MEKKDLKVGRKYLIAEKNDGFPEIALVVKYFGPMKRNGRDILIDGHLFLLECDSNSGYVVSEEGLQDVQKWTLAREKEIEQIATEWLLSQGVRGA